MLACMIQGLLVWHKCALFHSQHNLAFSIGLRPQVHVNVAKEMLFAFAEKKKEELELEVVYLVSGERGVRIARADKVGYYSFDFYATTIM